MNHKLQEEIGFLADTLSKWKPNMSISGLLDFHGNIGAKTQLIDVYKKTTLELRANRYDGLANTLEAIFEAFQKDVTERETKRYGKDSDQPFYDQLLSYYKITKPVDTRSSDIYLAFIHIEMSKQHLIDVLKKIAQLPCGGNADNECKHSVDFTSVTWYGQRYTFSDTQAKVVKLLWEAWGDPTKVGVNERDIGAAIETFAKRYRLVDTFYSRGKHHEAWGVMIKRKGKGIYALCEP